MSANEETIRVGIDTEIEGSGDLNEYEKALRRLEKIKIDGLSGLETAVKRVTKETKAGTVTVDQYTVKLRQSNQTVEQAANKRRAAELAAARLDITEKKLAQSTTDLTTKQRANEQQTSKLDLAQRKLALSTDQFNTKLKNLDADKFKAKLGAIKTAADEMASGMKKAGAALTLGVTAPLVGASAAGVKVASDIQESVANISTIKPEIDTSLLFKQLNEMSTRVPQSAAQLGEGLYNIFSSIETSQEGALNLLETFAKGAVGARTNTETFGTAILGVLNAYKLDVGDAAHLSDVFFNTVNKGVVNGEELATSLGTVTQAAKGAGLSFEELGGFIVGATKEGGPALQNIGTNLANFLNKLPGAEAQKQINLLGIDTTEMKDGVKQFRPALDVLTDLKKRLDNLDEVAQNTALSAIFPDIEAKRGARVVISQLDAVKAAIKQNVEESGSAEAAYQKMSATANAQFTILKNVALTALAAIGIALLPFIQPIVAFLQRAILGLVSFFSTLSPQVKIVIGVVAGFLAALGPVLAIAGTLLGIAISLAGSIAGIASAVAAAGGAAAVLAVAGGIAIAALKILPIIIVAVTVALAAVIAVVYLLYQVWTRNIGGIQQKAQSAFTAIRTFVISTLGQLRDQFNKILPQIRQLVETVLGAIQLFWQTHGATIVTVVQKFWNIVKTVFRTGIEIIGGVVRLVLALINGDWASAWDAAKQIFNAAWEAIITVLSGLVGIFVTVLVAVVKAIFNGIVAVVKAAWELGKRFVSAIWEAIKAAPGMIVDAVTYLFTNALSDLSSFLVSVGKTIWGYIYSGFTGAQAEQPLNAGVGAAVTAARAEGAKDAPKPAPTAPPPKPTGTLPAGFGKRGKKGAATPFERAKALEAAEKAAEEKSFALAQDAGERLLAANERAYQLELIAFGDYYGRKIDLRERLAGNEIVKAKNAEERIQSELDKVRGRLAGNTQRSEKNQLLQEEDRLLGELTSAQKELELATRKRGDVASEATHEAAVSLKEEMERVRATKQQYLELTDQQLAAQRASLAGQFDEKQRVLQQQLDSQKRRVGELQAAGLTEAAATLRAAQARTQQQIDQTAEIRRQLDFNAQFEEQQRSLQEIERQRGLKLDELNRTLEAAGTDETAAVEQRRAEYAKFNDQINAVIASLQTLLQLGAQNPEIKRTIEATQSQQAGAGVVPASERVGAAQRAFDVAMQRRQDLLRQNELAPQSEFQREQNRLQILRDTNAELQKQLGLWQSIAASTGNKQFIADAQGASDALREQNADLVVFKDTLKATAIDAFASGLTNFFTDLASGTKSLKDAAIDFAGTFIQAIQSIIIQMLALKLITASLKLFGFSGGGSFDTAPGFASGGAFQSHPLGVVRGPGTPTSDDILARVSRKEYILDAETTSNIGVNALDRLRAAKGRAWGWADGGSFAGAVNSMPMVPEFAGGDTNVALNQQLLLSPSALVREALKDRAVVRSVLEVVGNNRTRVKAKLED